ncbi:methyltransferase, partial [Staphylococcus aureus]|uniref:methyltransferase n=1 Tax=Staphylococcus aureus TaxID=1280 RepID=UPI0039BE850D
IAECGIKNRSFIGTNIFDEIPARSGLYTIKHVLYDWGDSYAQKLLTAIAKVMRVDSRLIIIDGSAG